LRSFTADPAAITSYGPLETEDGRVLEIEALRPAKDHFVATLAGIADREAAERLTNVKLYVPRERLPKPEQPDEYYHADLIGLAAVDRSGKPLGSMLPVGARSAPPVPQSAHAGAGAPNAGAIAADPSAGESVIAIDWSPSGAPESSVSVPRSTSCPWVREECASIRAAPRT